MNQEFTITKFKFKNFRPFKTWQEFSPKKLNIFIGPNNSGKSSLSELIKMCSGDFPNNLNIQAKNLRAKRFENLTIDSKYPIEIKLELELSPSAQTANNEPNKVYGFELSNRIEVHLKYQLTTDEFPVREIRICEIEITDLERGVLIMNGRRGRYADGNFHQSDGDSYYINWSQYYEPYLNKYNSRRINFPPKGERKITSNEVKPFLNNHNIGEHRDFLDKFNRLWVESTPIPYPLYDQKEFGFIMSPRMNDYSLQNIFSPRDIVDPFKQYQNPSDDRGNGLNRESLNDYLDNILNDGIENVNLKAFAGYQYYFLFNIHSLILNLQEIFPATIDVNIDKIIQSELYLRNELEVYSAYFTEPSSYYDRVLIEKWLAELGIADKIIKEELAEDYIRILLNRNGRNVSMNLLGRGTQQVVILITALLNRFPRISANGRNRNAGFEGNINYMYFLQEPETSLHPKYQSKLADLFIEAIKNSDRILFVETHSEFLIRKLQYLVAKKEIRNEDIQLVYFEEVLKTSESGKIREIPIRKDGFLLDQFGPGFFDESAKWTFELFKLQSEN